MKTITTIFCLCPWSWRPCRSSSCYNRNWRASVIHSAYFNCNTCVVLFYWEE